ncbi:hypothetical protein CKAN_01910400 [Cinnamomum micranthum f. kanehirae]|uniref:Uncharacterized protein n=1 Tax=Cinnamomum micranthum f. kanehirae TaxID=337451 RepID=A0A443PGW3_9MAGN|nr:hypothetical protein CKAN_01910400 [Cinnamomum micranthum f. kanehirae]
MCNECYIARMSGRPPFPPPTQSPFTSHAYFPFGNTTGTPYPFPPITSYETHPGQMMPAPGYPVYGRPQMPSPPVWPYQHANGYNYQKGVGEYNPQVQGMMLQEASRPFGLGGHQVPSPVWPNLQYADSSNFQFGDGKYNPQVQGVGRISNGGDFNMGPTMGNNNEFRL